MAVYDFMIGPYVTCIKIGFSKIDDVFPDDLKQKVIKALEAEGLGPDGKPLVKEEKLKEEKPVEDKEEDKETGAEVSPEGPNEEEPSNDPKDDAKEPEGEDKKESEEDKEGK